MQSNLYLKSVTIIIVVTIIVIHHNLEFVINNYCYYMVHFHGLILFFVMKLEYKRFGATDFKYEVREKRSYCRRECMKNINFKTIKTRSAWNNNYCYSDNLLSYFQIFIINIDACVVGK